MLLSPMLITESQKTERFTPEIAQQLKACDAINTFTESGWFFAYGYKNDKIVVRTHANSREEYQDLMNPKPYG